MAAAEGDDARVLQALFESYAAACRTGAEAIGEADADAAFEVRPSGNMFGVVGWVIGRPDCGRPCMVLLL